MLLYCTIDFLPLPGGIFWGFDALAAAAAKAQFFMQQHRIENSTAPIKSTIKSAIRAAKLGSKYSMNPEELVSMERRKNS